MINKSGLVPWREVGRYGGVRWRKKGEGERKGVRCAGEGEGEPNGVWMGEK